MPGPYLQSINLGVHFDGRVPIRKLNAFTGELAIPTVFLFLSLLSLYFLNLYLVFTAILPLWLASILQCFVVYGFFTPVHESVHENIGGKSKKWRFLDSLIGNVSSTIMLSPLFAFRYIHLTHHQKVNQPKLDPDYYVASSSWIVAVFKSLFVIPHYLVCFAKSAKPLIKKVWAILVVVIILGVLGFLGNFTDPMVITWMCIIPGWLGGALSVFLFDWVPHHPHEDSRPFYHARNFQQKWLDYPMLFQNFHQIHHLNPRIPFYRYRESFLAVMPTPEKKLKR